MREILDSRVGHDTENNRHETRERDRGRYREGRRCAMGTAFLSRGLRTRDVLTMVTYKATVAKRLVRPALDCKLALDR